MLYPDKESIIRVNKILTSHYNQPHFVIAEANLYHVLEQTRHYGENVENGEEKLLKKAAFMLFHLAYDAHIFTDGNKRTALAGTASFLAMNGYEIMADEGGQAQRAAIMKEIAEGKKSVSYIFKWLKKIVARKK